jgi:NitT/TauT family transport system permease protein
MASRKDARHAMTRAPQAYGTLPNSSWRAPTPARSLAPGRLWSVAGLTALVVAWDVAVRCSGSPLLPGPVATFHGLVELVTSGALIKHVTASLFRVLWGYLLAVAVALPAGLLVGTKPAAERVVGPLVQLLRPISPIAWIPLGILWLGVGDPPAVFIIFLGAFLPLFTATVLAVHQVEPVHVHAGRNFGLTPRQIRWHVILPAALPQILVAMRLALGIAWLVVVAAEMIAVDSGLGFLVLDARNAGDRYDLVLAGMVMIGLIGLGLDLSIQRVQREESRRRGGMRRKEQRR